MHIQPPLWILFIQLDSNHCIHPIHFYEKNPIIKMYNHDIWYDIIFLCYFPFLGVLLAYYSWKELKKGSINIRNRFTVASKEVKYEESCLRGSYSHNGHLSHKPIVQ
jgi:hypothetical protein